MNTSRGAQVLFLTAALEFVLGAGFLIAGTAELVPGTGMSFPFIGVALIVGAALMMMIAVRWRIRHGQEMALRTRMVRGTAQVLAARQTGVSINDQPQVALDLRVTAPGHGVYDASVKTFVPLIALGMLGSGRPLSVGVDPADRQRILVDWEFVPSASAEEIERAVAPAIDPAEAARTKAQILATGVPGTVRVLSAEFAGSLDEQGRPVYSAQLHIQVQGRPPVAGPAVFAVPLERVSVMQPGGVIPIKADPYDPQKFAADWDRLPAS
ncbi:hypothetical protein [Dactylosporangium sp. CA-139066]|uniref:hypothetical protein n=1 Tax=Dactylosporangium sp. CA-139066 TaxID=3239930 RepID=UPI003D940D18